MAWSGPLAVAAILAVAAGAAKLAQPRAAVLALRGTGLGFVSPPLVRIGAVLEAALGAVALSGAAPAMVGLGATYLAFAAWVAVVRSRPDIASCGCFGESDAPPSWRHVVLDVGLATGCIGTAVAGAPGLGAVLAAQPLAGVPFSIVVVVAAWLARVVLGGPQLALLEPPGMSQ